MARLPCAAARTPASKPMLLRLRLHKHGIALPIARRNLLLTADLLLLCTRTSCARRMLPELMVYVEPKTEAEADAADEQRRRLEQEAASRQLLEEAADAAFGRKYPSSLAWRLPRKRGLVRSGCRGPACPLRRTRGRSDLKHQPGLRTGRRVVSGFWLPWSHFGRVWQAIDMDAWDTPWRMLQGPDWRNPDSPTPDLTVFR